MPIHFFIAQSSGYLRRHSYGEKTSPTFKFLDKKRSEARKAENKNLELPYGKPGIALKTKEEWEEAFELLLKYAMKFLPKKYKGTSFVFYPGPEHRGLLTSSDIGII
jgi:hypothetical protein